MEMKMSKIPSTAVNEDNEFVRRVEEVWARCFEKLGQQSDSKDEYNEEFISSVEQFVKQAVEQDNKLPSILDQPLELAEVQRAIKRLRIGIDNFMKSSCTEVIKWLKPRGVCVKRFFEVRSAPKIGCKDL